MPGHYHLFVVLVLLFLIPGSVAASGYDFSLFGPAYVNDTIPDRMEQGRSYPVMLTFKNTGLTSWENGFHRTGLFYEGDITRFVAMPVFVEIPEGVNISPGQSITFFTTLIPLAGPGMEEVSFSVSMRSAQGDQRITELHTDTVTIVPQNGISSPVNGSILVQGFRPDLTYTVNGVDQGYLPGIVPDLKPGAYLISVSGPGFQQEKLVEVAEGTISTLYFTPEKPEPDLTRQRAGPVSDGTLLGYITANIPLILVILLLVAACITVMVYAVKKRKTDEEEQEKRQNDSEEETEGEMRARETDKLIDRLHHKPRLFTPLSTGPGSGSDGPDKRKSGSGSPVSRPGFRRTIVKEDPDPLLGLGSLLSLLTPDSAAGDGEAVDVTLKEFDVNPGSATARVSVVNRSGENLESGGLFLKPGEEGHLSLELNEPENDDYLVRLPVRLLLGGKELIRILQVPYNKGIAFLARGVLEKAYEFFGHSFTREAEETDALYRRALILQGWNLEEEALAMLEEVLRRNPDHEGALAAIEQIVAKRRKKKEENLPEPKLVEEFPDPLEERYTAIRIIGRDPFAVLILAMKNDTRELRVLKIPNMMEDPGSSFYTEISVLYQLRHPNVLKMFRAEFDPVTFLELEYASGVKYEGKKITLLRDLPVPIPPATWIPLMKQLTSGLAYLHAKGVRHYHLSPKHILLDDGMVPKISGLIKESLRHSGIGSPEEFFILAPEQVRPERYGNKGRRTDLYQLGAIWYWLVTGALPERNDEFVPDISDDLADEIGCLNLMKRLLTPEKRHRFRSADEFLQLFDDICTLPEQPDGEDPEA